MFPGGWIYEIETPKDGAYPGGMTPCFVPEPSLQTTMPTNNGYDEWLAVVEPEPEDYDKTAEADKELLTMGRFQLKQKGEYHMSIKSESIATQLFSCNGRSY